MSTIPFFGLKREHQKYQNIYLNIIDRIFKHGQVLQGNEINLLEKFVSQKFNRKYAVALNSCTDALYFCLKASGIKKGDEVLVTNFSYISSASSILRAGAKPVFVDVDETFNFNINLLERNITKKTKAIICVHLFGNVCNFSKIKKVLRKYKILLIEDNAQSLGAKYKGQYTGTISHYACLSFDPTKVISSPSSGGMVLTDNFKNYQKIKLLRYHHKEKIKGFTDLGFNSQMPSLTAAILLHKFKMMESWENKRIEIAKYFNDKLQNLCSIPVVEKNVHHIFHKYVIRHNKRKDLLNYLQNNKIECLIHYIRPLHREKIFNFFKYNDKLFKNSNRFSKEVLSLPIHPFLKDNEVQLIVEKMKKF